MKKAKVRLSWINEEHFTADVEIEVPEAVENRSDLFLFLDDKWFCSGDSYFEGILEKKFGPKWRTNKKLVRVRHERAVVNADESHTKLLGGSK